MPDEDSIPPTYSVSFCIRRITIESTIVKATWITSRTQSGDEPLITVEALAARAIEMSKAPDVIWEIESQETDLHPIQSPPPR